MPSAAFEEWDKSSRRRLDELERVHRDAGSGADEILADLLFVDLLAQFQTYCRNLHDEATDTYVNFARPHQSVVLRRLLTTRRGLDSRNPGPDTLGDDFGRFGFEMIRNLHDEGTTTREALRLLRVLVDFRNAVAHGNDSEKVALIRNGDIQANAQSFRLMRETIERLVGTIDQVVAQELAIGLGGAGPW